MILKQRNTEGDRKEIQGRLKFLSVNKNKHYNLFLEMCVIKVTFSWLGSKD